MTGRVAQHKCNVITFILRPTRKSRIRVQVEDTGSGDRGDLQGMIAQHDQKLPVTLLTGFLGSGKTTVLNSLLRQPDFQRTAVIVNEFGEVGLDHELVVSSTDDVILLESGCLCCALRGDLLETMADLHERRQAGEFEFERVVIETTGLADPAPVLHTLLTDAGMADCFVMDGVVTVVDAATGMQTLAAHEDARRQVALADLVLLTKTDLAQSREPAIRAAVSRLNAGVGIALATNGTVRAEQVLGLGHFDPAIKAQDVSRWMRAEAGMIDRPPGQITHGQAIRSVSWVVEEPLTADKFDFWMDILMAKRGEDLLRLKALVHLTDMPCPFVVHGVQHIFHPPVMLRDWEGADRRTKFVLILRDFTDRELRELFEALGNLSTVEHRLPGAYLAAEQMA